MSLTRQYNIVFVGKIDEVTVRELQDAYSGLDLVHQKTLLRIKELEAANDELKARYDEAMRQIAALQEGARSNLAAKPPTVKDFLSNRGRLSAKDLEPYQGKWVAFARDGSVILASGSDLPALEHSLATMSKNMSDVVVEYIPEEGTLVGGAQLL